MLVYETSILFLLSCPCAPVVAVPDHFCYTIGGIDRDPTVSRSTSGLVAVSASARAPLTMAVPIPPSGNGGVM